MEEAKSEVIGVMPLKVWKKMCPQPTERERIMRILAVFCAITRCQSAGIIVPECWLAEVEHVQAWLTESV